MNEPLVDIFLHGPLGKRYGFHHRLAVTTPRETVHALESQYPGFLAKFVEHDIYGIHCDGDWRESEHAPVLSFGREIHFVPIVAGQGPLLGALVGAFFPALTTTTIFGVTAASLVGGLLFTGLMIGVSLLLAPKPPKLSATQDDQQSNRNNNYAFTGPENVVQQGVAVPLIYGRVHAGSVVVSAGLEPGSLATTVSVSQAMAPLAAIEEEPIIVRGQDRPLIAGMGGSSKGGGGGSAGSSHTPTEAPDNLKSHQIAKVVDVISEGPIRGVVGGARGIFLDGVQLQNSNGSYNYSNMIIQFRTGTAGQSIMNGFASQQSEQAVSQKLGYPPNPPPVVRSILNTDVDRVRITVSTPTMQSQNRTTGDITGSSAGFRVDMDNNNGGWQLAGAWTITGKTTSTYQRVVVLNLPRPGPWDIRVYRTTPESTSELVQNDLYWESYTEIIDDRVNYTLSAAVGVEVDAEQFSSIPKRVYLTDGLMMRIPSNYNPDAATYTGTWDGVFHFEWTNNPAWIFYDLVTNNRYGIGDFVGINLIDKWAIYAIGVWCDSRVPDGRGGTQRRWTCNVQILDQQDAFDLLQQIASIFRGFTYWQGGLLIAVADKPSDPVYQFTNANVIDGQFTYAGSDRRARHTTITVAWRDPDQLGETRLAIVEDQDGMARYGVQKAELQAFGCTDESEAIRAGKWALYSELYEGESIQFQAGLEGAWVAPGNIVRVMDALISGKRRGGRIGTGSDQTYIYFDAPVPTEREEIYYLSCVIGADAHIETREAHSMGGDVLTVTASQPFSAPPEPDSVFVLNDPVDLEPTLWRILAGRQVDADKYELNGIRHYPSKWDYVERNKALVVPSVTDIEIRPPPVANLRLIEYLVATSPISVGVRVTLSWTSSAQLFDVFYRANTDNWVHVRTDQKSLDLATVEGPNTFTVTPIGPTGLKGPTATLNYTVVGTFALPEAPRLFRITVVQGVALFSWAPAPELDVIIGGHFELRHSDLQRGAQWNTSQVVITSIPGSATSVETTYMSGTWFLRTFDITGRASATWATIISEVPDDQFTRWVRICENPDWLGSRMFTDVVYPQNWLVIGQQSGLWDDQSDILQPGGIDSWPDVDMLPFPADWDPSAHENWGTYRFEQRFDAGGVFTIRFSSELLAFPFGDPDEFVDSRLTFSDTWADWDDINSDLQGQVQLMIRLTNDDPAMATANWGEWEVFRGGGEYTARGFEFMAVLTAPPGQNIGLETLCVSGDFRAKSDEGADIVYPAHDTTVWFSIKFYTVPAVVITVQDASNMDDINVLAKTRENFTLRITQAGAQVNRVFDFAAHGY